MNHPVDLLAELILQDNAVLLIGDGLRQTGKPPSLAKEIAEALLGLTVVHQMPLRLVFWSPIWIIQLF